MIEINQRLIDSLSSFDLELSMFFVNTFFLIVSLQASHLFYKLWREKQYG